MRVVNVRQGSLEWFVARLGIPTCSNFSRIITPAKGKPSAQADDYIAELIAETMQSDLPGPQALEKYASPAMQYGTDTEPEARRYFEMVTNLDVTEVGFCISDCGRFGGSPDGLIGEDSGLELKCPSGKTHVRYLLDGGLPDEYRPQVMGHLIVSGRPSWWFMSYCIGLPPLLVKVVPDEYTELLRTALEDFHGRYKTALESIRTIEKRSVAVG